MTNVLVPGRIGGIDDLYTRRIDWHATGDGVIVFTRLHGLGGDGEELMT